jgi:hypothetical protein
MILRGLATLLILGLLGLNAFLPSTSLGRRGVEARQRSDIEGAYGEIGGYLPDLAFTDIDGRAVRLSDYRGERVLLTFERSVDW